MLADLWTPSAYKPWLGRVSAMGLATILLGSFAMEVTEPIAAFGGMYVLDGFALFFKRFFLIATALVLLMSSEYAKTFRNGTGEYMSLSLFALSGMMFAASANHFALLFVSLELITITFYILTSFQRHQTISLEAGIKYLILGALSSAFLIYGIALVYGASGTMRFDDLREISATLSDHPLLLTGLLMILAGLGFKIAAFPFQIWAPDVYQGSPTSTTPILCAQYIRSACSGSSPCGSPKSARTPAKMRDISGPAIRSSASYSSRVTSSPRLRSRTLPVKTTTAPQLSCSTVA